MKSKTPPKGSNTATGPYDLAPLLDTAGKLRAARHASGKTLGEVAAATGLGVAAICRLENGFIKNPRYATLARLASGLGGSLVVDFTLP